MAFAAPEPGLVISFNYVWRREHQAGVEHAPYPRPCLIIVAQPRPDGAAAVMVVPITTRPPRQEDEAVLLPTKVKRHLGLDEGPSWVIVDEVNEFVWPGFDLAPMSGGRIDYGFIPPALFDLIRDRMISCLRSGGLKRTPR